MDKLRNNISFSAIFHFLLLTFIFVAVIALLKQYVLDYAPSNVYLYSNPFFSLVPIKNTGAAFSILTSKTTFLIYVSFFVLVGITSWIVYYSKTLSKPEIISVSLLISGVLANLYERMVYGYVLDYIKLNFVSFPIFNFADIAIVSGAILYVFIIFSKRD